MSRTVIRSVQPVEDRLGQDIEPNVAVKGLAPARIRFDNRLQPRHDFVEVAALAGDECARERDLLLRQSGGACELNLLLEVRVLAELVPSPVGGGDELEAPELAKRIRVVVDAEVEYALPGFSSRSPETTRSAAASRSRKSPPASSAASRAARSRSASVPSAASNVSAAACQTAVDASMFPCAERRCG
jgi:hypothetical protein